MSALHGWPGLLSAYASVQGPLMAALARARAPLRQWLLSPLLAAPVTALAGLSISAAAPLLRGLAAGNAALEVFAAAGFSAALGYGAGRVLARRAPPAALHQRGALVLEEPPRAPAGAGPARAGRAAARERITLAGIALSPEDEVKHFKLIGTTGTGKSTAIRELLAAALARGDRAVIADPDGGYLRRFYDARRGDVILNPFEAASARWDLFGEISDDYDVEQLARSLIPDHEGSDRSWRGYARTFFSAVTAQAHAAGSRDVRELYRLLVVAGTPELRTLVAGTPAQPFLEEHNGRMFDSIRSVTSSAVGALEYVARQRSAPLAVRSWVQQGAAAASGGTPARGVLFLPYRAGQVAALRSTISAWMRLAIFEAMNREEGDQRLWFVVDELDALGQIDGLKDALARVRKFGGRCVLGFQSIAQVSSTYGSGEAQTLVENCANTLILRCSGSEHGGTSQFASRLIGEREVLRVQTSRSRRGTELLPAVTRSEHLGLEAAVMGAQIEQLPDLAGYLKIASRPEWRRVRLAAPGAVRERSA
ncbi:MAG TPA: type IV secretion system DNA-binding domain-containing protein, partial [Steroidobacteraceae bacterium]|nr:type IV secretion system DNA-binding domain-containing protein [Steroidobacteraceae bacterium]